MSQVSIATGHDFTEALTSYSASLASNNLGVIEGASFLDKSGTKKNIFVTIIGMIIGAFTGFGFYRTADADTGTAVLTEDGLHFFSTETEKVRENGVKVKKLGIKNHAFVHHSQVSKAVTSRSFIFSRQLSLVGTSTDLLGHSANCRIDVPLSGNEQAIEALKYKLSACNVTVRKSRTGKVVGSLLLAFFAAIFFIIFFPRLTTSYRAMDYADFRHEINSPTHSASARYQGRRTSFTARVATDVFTVDFGDGSIDFVGAAIAGNDRIFLLELSDVAINQGVGDIIHITAVGAGVITTRPRPEQSAADRFFESLGAAFGDPRISGVVAATSAPSILTGTYYLHMRATAIESVETIVLGESDTYVAANGNFQISFVDAFFSTTGAGQRQTDIIVIFFDYESLTSHSASRPFNRFVVYQGDTELARGEGGIRSAEADGRGFLSTQRVEQGEVFRAMGSVVAANLTDPIRIVVYGSGFDMLFMYEMPVR